MNDWPPYVPICYGTFRFRLLCRPFCAFCFSGSIEKPRTSHSGKEKKLNRSRSVAEKCENTFGFFKRSSRPSLISGGFSSPTGPMYARGSPWPTVVLDSLFVWFPPFVVSMLLALIAQSNFRDALNWTLKDKLPFRRLILPTQERFK